MSLVSQTFSPQNKPGRVRAWQREYFSAICGGLFAISCFSLFPSVDAKVLTSPPQKGFQLCFLGKPVPTPSTEVQENLNALRPMVERISAQFEHGPENQAFVLAIAAEESGARVRSVNPLGFAGLFASSSQGSSPACCVKDDEDAYHWEYDLCNSERIYGVRCDFEKDPRFQAEQEIREMFGHLEHFRSRIDPKIKGGEKVDIPSALTAYWSSSPSSVADFPSHLGSPQKFFEALNVSSSNGYENWSTMAVATRLIEAFDHVAAFRRFLALDSESANGPESIDEKTLVCWNYFPVGPDTVSKSRLLFFSGTESLWKRSLLPKIRVQRLNYGIYNVEDAWIDLNYSLNEQASS